MKRYHEPRHEGRHGHGHGGAAGDGLGILVELCKALVLDLGAEVLEALRRAVEEGADVGAVLEGLARIPHGAGEIGHRLSGIALTTVHVFLSMPASRCDEPAPALNRHIGNPLNIPTQGLPVGCLTIGG